jgi:hypothetical protein
MDRPVDSGIHRSRSYRPVPPVLRTEGEWEGGMILQEISSSCGRYLFGTLRDVMLWLVLPPNRRDQAFAPGSRELRASQLRKSDAPLELRGYLSAILRICDGEIGSDEVGAACLAIATWARTNGALHTELAYRQAAALASPNEAVLSLATARLSRDLALHRRSETWYRHSIKLARTNKDWNTYIRAYLGLGRMYDRLGNGPAAKAVMERALKAALRWRLRQLAGEAHHDLFHVWAPLDLRVAYEHARSAEVNYRSAPKELLARLAGDVATIWVRVGAGRRAFEVFQSVLPFADDRGLRAIWAAQLVRCATTSELASEYERLRVAALADIAQSPDPWRSAEAQLIVSWADLAVGEWDRAALMAESALTVAIRLGAGEIQAFAERAISDALARDPEGSKGDSLGVERLETPTISRMADEMAGSICEAVADPRPHVSADAG